MTPPSTDSSRIHPAWIVLVAVTLCMMASSGIRSVFGVYIRPLETEFGWTRGALSGVAAISLLLLGAAGPFAGRLADRWGPRRVIVLSLFMLGVGSIGAAMVAALWQLYLTTGVLMGIGSGGLGLATGSVIATRWFEARRGLAIGIAAGGMSAGQLVIIPLAAALMVWFGWRASVFWLGVSVLAVVLPLAAWLIRNDPADRGLRPYGATSAATAAPSLEERRAARVGVIEAAQHPQFWLLMATFFVCGYTTNGMVLTHFMPHALEHSFTELQASTALGIMGAMNVLGTIASGWVCDRFGRRGPLATYYFLRGISLVFLVYVWDTSSLHLWAAIYGLNYISTVPPTTTLTASIFGQYSVGELSGWIFFAHQVGAALGAAIAGWVFEIHGSYGPAFIAAAVLGIVAAVLTMLIREESVISRPMEPATA
jgi:MFS family permease